MKDIKEGDFVIVHSKIVSSHIRYVTKVNKDETFVDDGLVSGLPPSTRCYFHNYEVMDISYWLFNYESYTDKLNKI